MVRFQGMTCGELAVAIDYERKAEKQARDRAFSHGMSAILGKESDRLSKKLSEGIERGKADKHKDIITELRVLSAKRGCGG